MLGRKERLLAGDAGSIDCAGGSRGQASKR